MILMRWDRIQIKETVILLIKLLILLTILIRFLHSLTLIISHRNKKDNIKQSICNLHKISINLQINNNHHNTKVKIYLRNFNARPHL